MLTLLLSSWDDILQFIVNLHNTGISWGAVITAIILWSKMKRNKRFAERDERMEDKVDALLRERGITWNGQAKISRNEDLLSLRRFFLLSRKEIPLGNLLRRVRKMNQVNWTTLLPGLISAAKLVLQSFGIDIPDEHINSTANGIAAVGAIIAICMSHKKQGGTKLPQQPYNPTSYQ